MDEQNEQNEQMRMLRWVTGDERQRDVTVGTLAWNRHPIEVSAQQDPEPRSKNQFLFGGQNNTLISFTFKGLCRTYVKRPIGVILLHYSSVLAHCPAK